MSANQSEYFNKDFEVLNPDKLKIACVVSEWHNEITEKLFSGAKNILTKNALYRICSQNIYSKFNYPSANNTALDGFAINSQETKNATNNKKVKRKHCVY